VKLERVGAWCHISSHYKERMEGRGFQIINWNNAKNGSINFKGSKHH
jgi:hypothetical protein